MDVSTSTCELKMRRKAALAGMSLKTAAGKASINLLETAYGCFFKRQSAVPGLCCIVTRRLDESVGRVFDTIVSSGTAVFEHVKDELVGTLFAPSDLVTCAPGSRPL